MYMICGTSCRVRVRFYVKKTTNIKTTLHASELQTHAECPEIGAPVAGGELEGLSGCQRKEQEKMLQCHSV